MESSTSGPQSVLRNLQLAWSGSRRFLWAGSTAAFVGAGYYFHDYKHKSTRKLCDEEARYLVLSHAERLGVALGPGWTSPASTADADSTTSGKKRKRAQKQKPPKRAPLPPALVRDPLFLAARAAMESRHGDQAEALSLQEKALNLAAAKRVLRMCKGLGGIYCKAGQYASTMSNALPDEYTKTLSELTDAAKGITASEALAVARRELRCGAEDCSDLFETFDPEPLGRASLAQVHRARLRNGGVPASGSSSSRAAGQEVAVKVQYPGLAGRALGDILGMRAIAGALAWLFPQHDYKWLLPDYEQVLALELDFAQEGHNAARARAAMSRRFGAASVGGGNDSDASSSSLASSSPSASWMSRSDAAGGRGWGPDGWRDWLTSSPADGAVAVPGVAWGLTTRRVLTMQLAGGVKPTKEGYQELQRRGVRPETVARRVIAAYSSLMFEAGLVHCDPHPGNILVRPLGEEGPWRQQAIEAERRAKEAKEAIDAAVQGADARVREGEERASGRSDGAKRRGDRGQQMSRAAGEFAKKAAGEMYRGGVDRPFELVMLDHGMYSRLSPSFRRAWCDVWYAAVHGDMELGADACRRMGLTDEEEDEEEEEQEPASVGRRGAAADSSGNVQQAAESAAAYAGVVETDGLAKAQATPSEDSPGGAASSAAGDGASRGAGIGGNAAPDSDPAAEVVPLAARTKLTAKDYFDVLSLILTYRPASSGARLGFALSIKELERLRKRFEGWDEDQAKAFFRALPRDVLLVLRSIGILRSVNQTLGGTTRDRLASMAEAAARGRALTQAAASREQELGLEPPEPVRRLEEVEVPGVLELDGPVRLLLDMALEETADDRLCEKSGGSGGEGEGEGGAAGGLRHRVQEAGQPAHSQCERAAARGSALHPPVIDWELEAQRDSAHRLARPKAELNLPTDQEAVEGVLGASYVLRNARGDLKLDALSESLEAPLLPKTEDSSGVLAAVRRDGAWAAFESRWRLAIDDATMLLSFALSMLLSHFGLAPSLEDAIGAVAGPAGGAPASQRARAGTSASGAGAGTANGEDTTKSTGESEGAQIPGGETKGEIGSYTTDGSASGAGAGSAKPGDASDAARPVDNQTDRAGRDGSDSESAHASGGEEEGEMGKDRFEGLHEDRGDRPVEDGSFRAKGEKRPSQRGELRWIRARWGEGRQ